MSEEALQTAVERREAKGKGGWERYTQLNTEFQRIARRDKKAFLNEQCREIKESNSIGKTRDLFVKIRYIKERYHARIGTVKERSGKALTEAQEIKKSWQEYTEELYKNLKYLNNHAGVVTQLQPDILECEVKWALRSITMMKASGGDGIPAELFSNPKRCC